MMRRKTVLVVLGFLAGAAGAEAAWVDAHITLQKQGAVCRGQVDKLVWVWNADDGVLWRIVNLDCDEPAYVEIKADTTGGNLPLPSWCEGTFKVPDAVSHPPTCDFPPQPSYDGTYGFQVYVNCKPTELCPPADPEIVVERIRGYRSFFPLNPLVKPSPQRLLVKVTLRKVAGACQAQLDSSATLLKEHKAIEWTFDNKCDKGPHYVDLRRVAAEGTLKLPDECNQSGAIRESPMGARCHLENTMRTAGTYEYSVAVDCIGNASCAPTKATILVPR